MQTSLLLNNVYAMTLLNEYIHGFIAFISTSGMLGGRYGMANYDSKKHTPCRYIHEAC